MKKRFIESICILCSLIMAGCANAGGTNKYVQENPVEEVISERITEKEQVVQEAPSIDIDLTSMSSDMVYATVFQLVICPENYLGQTIKLRGNYYATWYEPTQKYYHYAIIQDAAACCAQGMEFIWEDGSHQYPEEYPEDNAVVEITGVFETYTEEGDENLYCRLKDATLKVISEGELIEGSY